ncbi:MAG TPA: HD domain-containing protein [Draconibacterium sp.]|nr:HD domain-containing protein [Draconibacterium sp.]
MDVNESKLQVLKKTEKYIHSVFEKEDSGHDWWHIYRVRNMALEIAKQEGGDLFIIEMASLVHDLDDWKLNHSGNNKTLPLLEKLGVDKQTIEKVLRLTEQVSFKGAGVPNKATTLEAQIVQDADRLDAIGAIGIARTFAYGGSKGRLIYDPSVEPVEHIDFDSYKSNTAPTLNHFYEKLLLLKDRLNTRTARKIGEERHRFMEIFLEQFFVEWNTKF